MVSTVSKGSCPAGSVDNNVGDSGLCEGLPGGLPRVVPGLFRASWQPDLVLSLNSIPSLCVTLGTSFFNLWFHISKIGIIILYLPQRVVVRTK